MRARTHVDARARAHTCSQTRRPFVGPYAFGASNSNVCPSSYTPIPTAAECAAAAVASVAAAAAAGIATTAYNGVMSSSVCSGDVHPMGCFYSMTGSCIAVGVWFNPDPVGAARSSGRLLCRLRGTAAPTNAGDTNAPTTAIMMSTTLSHGMTRAVFTLRPPSPCTAALVYAPLPGPRACAYGRLPRIVSGLAGDVSSISIGAFVWRCGSNDCYPNDASCSLGVDAFAHGGTELNGTLPDAIGRLSCRSKITSMYAPQR
jgi:hypothetical protein